MNKTKLSMTFTFLAVLGLVVSLGCSEPKKELVATPAAEAPTAETVKAKTTEFDVKAEQAIAAKVAAEKRAAKVANASRRKAEIALYDKVNQFKADVERFKFDWITNISSSDGSVVMIEVTKKWRSLTTEDRRRFLISSAKNWALITKNNDAHALVANADGDSLGNASCTNAELELTDEEIEEARRVNEAKLAKRDELNRVAVNRFKVEVENRKWISSVKVDSAILTIEATDNWHLISEKRRRNYLQSFWDKWSDLTKEHEDQVFVVVVVDTDGDGLGAASAEGVSVNHESTRIYKAKRKAELSAERAIKDAANEAERKRIAAMPKPKNDEIKSFISKVGKVARISKRDIVVDVSSKSDGFRSENIAVIKVSENWFEERYKNRLTIAKKMLSIWEATTKADESDGSNGSFNGPMIEIIDSKGRKVGGSNRKGAWVEE